jgi:hypothetical protein
MPVLRASVTVVTLAVAVALAPPATGRQIDGRLIGLFAATGSSKVFSEFALSGVVTLTSNSGKVRRITVDRRGKTRLRNGRFTAKLAPGSYRISDRPSGHSQPCGVFQTGRSFNISNPFAPVANVLIEAGRRTYVRINCFDH